YDLGIFSQVDTAVQDPEGIQPRKNVLVEVQEARRYTFNYGAGFEFQTGQAAISGSGSKALGETGVSPLASLDVHGSTFAAAIIPSHSSPESADCNSAD